MGQAFLSRGQKGWGNKIVFENQIMCPKYWFAADNKMKKRGIMGGEGKSPERSYDLSFSLEDVQALNKQKQGGYAIQKGCQQKFTCACIWICSSFPSQ